MKLALSSLLCASLALSQLNASEPKHYDAAAIAEIFTKLNGDPSKPAQKVNHAKGFCASGTFYPNKELQKSLNLPFFKADNIKAQIRYSLGGALMSDKTKPRGMALKLEGDEIWTMVMLATPINFAKDPDEFGQFFDMRLPVNGKVDKEKIARLMQEVDSYRNFNEYNSKIGITPSVANTPYFSVHTFFFEDTKGASLPARWRFAPKAGVKYMSQSELEAAPNEFLKANLIKELKSSPVSYDMYITLANKDDVINSTTALWHGEHKEILAGRLDVRQVDSDECDSWVYFPSELPSSVNPPIDPLFDVRNEAYAITFGARAGK